MRSGRLARRRVRTLTIRDPRATTDVGDEDAVDRSPLVRLGRMAEQVLQRLGVTGPNGDRTTSRIRGSVVLLASLFAMLSPAAALGFGLLGWHLPTLVDRLRRPAARRQLEEDVLIAAELCAVSMQTGTSVSETLATVTPYLPATLRPVFDRAVAACRAGAMLDDELVRITDQVGPPVAPLVSILRAAHIDGDPVLPALGRLTDRLRAQHRRALESDVRQLSIRLLLPLVCCSLPGFVLLGVVPLVVDAFGGLAS